MAAEHGLSTSTGKGRGAGRGGGSNMPSDLTVEQRVDHIEQGMVEFQNRLDRVTETLVQVGDNLNNNSVSIDQLRTAMSNTTTTALEQVNEQFGLHQAALITVINEARRIRRHEAQHREPLWWYRGGLQGRARQGDCPRAGDHQLAHEPAELGRRWRRHEGLLTNHSPNAEDVRQEGSRMADVARGRDDLC